MSPSDLNLSQPTRPVHVRRAQQLGHVFSPDLAGAARYALQRLARELSPTLTYHGLSHTRDDVVLAVERLAALEGIGGEALLVLRTAAYFHDLGFVQQRAGHEALGAAIVAEVLPTFGYSSEQIASIQGIILATRLPQAPRNQLEALLADADLDVLGRADFVARNQALRAELAAYGMPSSDVEWYRGQIAFLEAHQYFTAAARTLRAAGKQHNLQQLRRRLALARAEDDQHPSPLPTPAATNVYHLGKDVP